MRLHRNSIFDLSVKNEPGVYFIIHEPSMMIYVGSTSRLRHRFTQHLSCLRKGYHPCKELQRLYNLDGKIKIFIAETCSTPEEALYREQLNLDSLRPHGIVLNIGNFVHAPTKGVAMSDSTKAKLSLSLEKVNLHH